MPDHRLPRRWRSTLAALAGLAGLLCWCAAATGAAADTGTDPALVIERLAQSYVVARDGSYTVTVDEVRRIVLERAIQPHSQYYISYNGTLDTLGPVRAYTEKPGGRRVALGPARIKDQLEAASADTPLFQDQRVKVLVFPAVQAGDRLVLHYTLHRRRALFPGQFEDLSSSPFYRHDNFTLTYDLPAGMPLYADAVGFTSVPVTARPGRRAYRWAYTAGANERIEADSVSYLDYGKRLAVSTFADYAALARAYQARASAPAVPTPAIAALAARITGALPGADQRSKALALSDWVRRNVRYVGVYIGPGGVVPHAAGQVLANRYGDCKDHVVLLEALLRAAGLASSGALVNAGNVYRLPRVPTLGIFNHIITYVPSLDLYLDSTAENIAAGYLPDGTLGKPVLLTRSGTLSSTPFRQREVYRNTALVQIGKLGNSRFRVTKTGSGAIAEPFRQAVRDTKPADRELWVERLLQDAGQRGYGVLDPGRLDGDGDDYQFVFAGVSDDFAQLPGPTGVGTGFSLWGGIGEQVAALLQEKSRRQEFVCLGLNGDDETGFEFAPGLAIMALPKALVLEQAGLAYRADYTRDGNTVTVRRQLLFAPDSMVCTPEQFRAWAPLFEQMQRDLKSQIIVQTL